VRRRSLAFRLLMANLAVVIVGAAAMFATARLIGPQLFDTEVQEIGQRYGWNQTGRGSGRTAVVEQQGEHIEAELNDAYSASLTMALAVALGIGAVASAGAAAFVSRRLLRPLNRMRGAVRSMAEGNYDEKVPEPREIELADLADDVNALGSALAITEERRARLVSDLSHELRTPITSLDGFVEGLEDGVFTAEPEILAAMRGETRRLRRLASDLGALSRADEEAFDLQTQEADLGSVATAAARGLTAAFTSAGVELDIAGLPELPVTIDIDRMVQVFTNLLRNALQHTPRCRAPRQGLRPVLPHRQRPLGSGRRGHRTDHRQEHRQGTRRRRHRTIGRSRERLHLRRHHPHSRLNCSSVGTLTTGSGSRRTVSCTRLIGCPVDRRPWFAYGPALCDPLPQNGSRLTAGRSNCPARPGDLWRQTPDSWLHYPGWVGCSLSSHIR